MTQVTQCRSCGAPILWRRHAITGRLAPIDAEPNPEGSVILLTHDLYTNTIKHVPADGPLHSNHFQTCPQKQMWAQRAKGVSGG